VKFEAEVDGQAIAVEVAGAAGHYRVVAGDEVLSADARQVADGVWSILLDGVSHVVEVSEQDGVSVVQVAGARYDIRIEEETRYVLRTRGRTAAGGGQVLKAPMPGKVVVVEVSVGQVVAPGDGLVVLEAMKMENEFEATVAGTVMEIRVEPGQTVNPGDTLVVIG
jgi:biotin carboxyl carrier protein